MNQFDTIETVKDKPVGAIPTRSNTIRLIGHNHSYITDRNWRSETNAW